MAIEFRGKLKKWGRSFGVVVPMEKLKEIDFEPEEKFDFIMIKEENPLEKHFGTHKFKRPIKEILDEGDKESWDE